MSDIRTRLLATSLVLAASLPAAAQVKAPAPATAPAPAPALAAVREIKLPTSADGEVTYKFDTATNLPISASDDRAQVVAVGVSFLPKKKGEDLRWVYYYSLRFPAGAKPTLVMVYDESQRPIKLEVGDNAPILQDGSWSATSQPKVVDKKTWDSMIGKDPWYLQRKFIIDYADGHRRTLHQLSVVTQTMRLGLLEQVTGQKLLEPAPAAK